MAGAAGPGPLQGSSGCLKVTLLRTSRGDWGRIQCPQDSDRAGRSCCLCLGVSQSRDNAVKNRDESGILSRCRAPRQMAPP